MKPRTKIILSLVFALLLIGFIPTYDLFIKDNIDSVEVVVVKAGEEIKRSEEIDDSKLTIERRRKQDLVDNVVYKDDIALIVGLDAADLLVGNTMVSTNMIDFDELVPNEEEGEAIRPITNDMIYAKPGSLRRKDSIDIYVIAADTFSVDEEVPSNVVSSSDEVEEEDEKKEAPKDTEEIDGDEENKLNLKEPILTDVKVIYAKDSSNQEVMNVEGETTNESERLTSTGQISDLELLLNEEDFQLLMSHVIDKEDKLYISYN